MIRPSKRRVLPIALMQLFLVTGILSGISVRPLKLAEMAGLSDRVFLGRVVGVESAHDSRLGINVTSYKFIVLEGIKGPTAGETVLIRQAGGAGGNLTSVPGLPVYRKGQEVLLFLHGDSRLGLTSPVGMIQGVFRQVDLPDGGKGFYNGTGNSNLGLDYRQADRSIPSSSAESGISITSAPGPVTIEMLKNLVGSSGIKGAGLK